MKVCLITCAKNEDEHIEEFLDHYFNIIKIDHIFWIDNNTKPLKPVVINDNRVTVIDKTNVNFDVIGDKTPLNMLMEVINETYQNYIVGNYDWCCYFDPDELLELNHNDIHTYLKNKSLINIILVKWVLHGNNNYIWESELPSNKMKINYGFHDNQSEMRVEYKPIFKVNKDYIFDHFFYNEKKIIYHKDYKKLNIYIDNNIKLHHYRLQCIETYIKHKIINGFYGQVNRESWCSNLFDASQFYESNPIITADKFAEFKKVIVKYEIDKIMTENDKEYLFKNYKISL